MQLLQKVSKIWSLAIGSNRCSATQFARLFLFKWYYNLYFFFFFYRVVKLLQSGKREETVHADSVFNQQLDKVHPVQD